MQSFVWANHARKGVSRSLQSCTLRGASCISSRFPGTTTGQMRYFSSKHEDLSLEGRYSSALLSVTKEKGNMDKVFDDLSHMRACIEQSPDFKLFVETPAIQPAQKEDVINALGKKYSYDGVSTNFLKCLLENRRLPDLKKMVDAFERFYRAEKGQIICQVTSSKELSSSEQGQVEKALSARAKGQKLIVSYAVNSAIKGGLVVKMGDAVLDYSVSSRLDRLVAKLLTPL